MEIYLSINVIDEQKIFVVSIILDEARGELVSTCMLNDVLTYSDVSVDSLTKT